MAYQIRVWIVVLARAVLLFFSFECRVYMWCFADRWVVTLSNDGSYTVMAQSSSGNVRNADSCRSSYRQFSLMEVLSIDQPQL